MSLQKAAIWMVSLGALLGACGNGSGTTGGSGASSGSGASGATSSGAGGAAASSTTQSATSSATGSSVASTGSSASGGSSKAKVMLTFQGTCAPDFTSALVVVTNSDSIAVSTTQAPLSSIQLALHETSGTQQLSTQQRVTTGDVINVIASSTTWTNISSQMPDPIKGQLTINHYDQTAGVIDLAFSGVVLENVQDHSLCTVDGTLVTTGKSF